MNFRKYYIAGVFVLLGFCATPAWSANNFDKLFQAIDRYRLGTEERALKVLSQDKGIVFYKGESREITEAKLKQLLQQPIKPGVHGRKIQLVQEGLVKNGIVAGNWTEGVFDEATKKALKEFQKRNKLPSSGVLDGKTWLKLFPSIPFSASIEESFRYLGKAKGIQITHSINSGSIVEEYQGTKGGTTVKPIEWNYKTIATVPKSEWPSFVAKAAQHGLMDMYVVNDGGEKDSAILMTFKRKGVESIPMGGRGGLKLSTGFYRYMKVSKKYGYRRGPSGKFVVLVHEPHDSINGQFQMLPGLKQLLEDNNDQKVRFLVEGDLPKKATQTHTSDFLNNINPESEAARAFSNADLMPKFSQDSQVRKRQVLNALSDFIIDGSSAYQILYDPSIPSLAIDDPQALASSPRSIEPAPPLKVKEMVDRLKGKLAGTGAAEAELDKVFDYLLMLEAISADLSGEDMVEWIESKREIYEMLSKTLSPLGTSPELEFLEQQSKAYDSQKQVYTEALVRDKTMAGFINYHFRSKSANRLPIAFIGSFHTPGIIAKLDQDIGYVVIEPQRDSRATEQEREKFNDALHDFQGYLNKLTHRKLNTKLDPEEAQQYLAYEGKKASGAAVPPEISSALGDTVGKQLFASINGNLKLADAKVLLADAGGTGAPPNVPRLPGLIASFHPGERGIGGHGNASISGDGLSASSGNGGRKGRSGGYGNNNGNGGNNNGGNGGNTTSGGEDSSLPLLFLYAKDKDGWKNPAEKDFWANRERLEFFKNMLFLPHPEIAAKKTQRMSFEYDGDKIYAIYYDSQRGDYFVFEGDKQISGASLLNLNGINNLYFHMNLSAIKLSSDKHKSS